MGSDPPEVVVLALTAETVEKLNRGAAAAQAERRRAAYHVFEETPAPSSAEESWRYADLDVSFEDLRLPDGPGEPLGEDEFLSSLSDAVGRALIVDGYLVALDGDGSVEARRATEAWGESPGLVTPEIDKLAAGALAFGGDGVVLRVPPHAVVERPFVVDVQLARSGTVSFPQVVVEAGENSEASVVVVYRCSEGLDALTSPSVSVHVGDGARLRFTTVQNLGGAATLVAHQRVVVGRDATARLGEVGLGSRFGRLDLGITLEGAGGSAQVVGLFYGEGSQVLDYRMVIDHVGSSTTSDVFLKGAVEDEARSVFTGLLKIERDAARSSAFETNRNLVLSEGAKAHSVPNLEILCDDVRCGHGSAVGPLEEEHIYYLMSRGLPRQRAQRLLVRGFFQEVIDRLPAPRLAVPIGAAVNRRFVAAQEGGRLR